MTAAGESIVLLERGAEPWFEGPAPECPVCTGALGQLALILDLEGGEPLNCSACGAVLAA